jgi:hypothetical protein
MHGAQVADGAGADQDESHHIGIGRSLCQASPDHQVGSWLIGWCRRVKDWAPSHP